MVVSFADVFEIQALESAPYSSSVVVYPSASLGFTGTYEGQGDSVELQAFDALQKMGADFSAMGIGPKDVVNVRAYIKSVKGEGMEDAMKAWSKAFTSFFKSESEPPTRTSIGVSSLQHEGSLIAIDCVIAVEEGRLESVLNESGNERILKANLESDRSTRFAKPYSSMLFTSGMLADSLVVGGSDYGTMKEQTLSTFARLKRELRTWGLVPEDIIYARALLSPKPEASDEEGVDYSGFEAAWADIWKRSAVGGPPLSVLAAPGFNATGRIVEIEVYAVFPDASGPFPIQGDNLEKDTYPIARKGQDTSFLSSSAAIARDANLVWFSGAIDRTHSDIQGQGVNALLTLDERMAALGLEYESVFQLRAYLNIQESFRKEFGEWNSAYRRFFDHAKLNPEKPVRTAFPIENLPADALIEIEMIGAFNY